MIFLTDLKCKFRVNATNKSPLTLHLNQEKSLSQNYNKIHLTLVRMAKRKKKKHQALARMWGKGNPIGQLVGM